MKFTGNTMLVTGGGTGIGRGLAESFHAMGNKVIIAGRRRAVLEETAAAFPGMDWLSFDAADAASIANLAATAIAKYPALNAVVANAGMMQEENVLAGTKDLAAAEATVTLNLLGPLRLIAALTPHFLKQPQACIMTVSSGLAFLPRASHPTYSATKAAIHAYSLSLRYQLAESPIRVIELIPPYVQTELTGAAQAVDPRAMPLANFIAEVMAILKANPAVTEVCVERVKPLRFAEANGGFENTFKQFNDALKKPAAPH